LIPWAYAIEGLCVESNGAIKGVNASPKGVKQFEMHKKHIPKCKTKIKA